MCAICDAMGLGQLGGDASGERFYAGFDTAGGEARIGLIQGYVDTLIGGVVSNRWNANAPLGTPTFVTYSFMQGVPSYFKDPTPGFQVYSAAQQASSRLALQAWSAISGVNFLEVSDAGAGGQVRFGMYDFTTTTPQFAGFAYFPFVTATSVSELGGDIFMAGNTYANDPMSPGSFAYMTLLHEIGHAIGLKHPFDGAPTLPSSIDNRFNTVMSYTGGTPASLGHYDLSAARYLYGPGTAIPTFWDEPNLTLTFYGADVAQTFVCPTINSIVAAAGGDDVVMGGEGNDWLFGGEGSDNITGGNGNDVLYGDINAENGNDLLDGGGGNDILIGGNGTDTLRGSAGNDWLFGSNGDDVGFCGDGDDVFYGDLFAGESGNDTGEGGLGNDVVIGGAGNDVLYGGFIDGTAEAGNDSLYGSDGNDTLFGGDGEDILYGDLFAGESGNDVMYGGNDNDFLWGGDGDDLIVGGAGTDNLYGGAGVDTFVFASAGDAANDTINDFSTAAGGDVLDLRGLVPAGTTFAAFFANNLAQSGGDTLLRVGAAQVTMLGVNRAGFTANGVLL